MMSWLVCAEVPDEYVPMMLEEMDLTGRDERAFDWHAVPAAARAEFPIVVIGCGQSGCWPGSG
jgi:4-hydroxyacetophenone monooxygenase